MNMEILSRSSHKVDISFTIDIVPELVEKLKVRLNSHIYAMLGYPMQALDVDYSFNNPELPEVVNINIERVC